MTRTNIEIDDAVIERVMRRYGLRIKRSAVDVALLYRACRRQGATIRRLPDCLIATVAMRTNTSLLHQDGDFDAIARHAPLRDGRVVKIPLNVI